MLATYKHWKQFEDQTKQIKSHESDEKPANTVPNNSVNNIQVTEIQTIGSISLQSGSVFFHLHVRLLFKNKDSVQITVQHSAILQRTQTRAHTTWDGTCPWHKSQQSVVSFNTQTPTTNSRALLEKHHVLAQVDCKCPAEAPNVACTISTAKEDIVRVASWILSGWKGGGKRAKWLQGTQGH